MVNFILYNDDGDTIEDIIFNSEELVNYIGSVVYTWQDLDELGYKLLDEYNNSGTFSWEYLGGEED